MIDKKEFLTTQIIDAFANLKADTQPQFGLMTAQHMVEHLCYVTKITAKNNGPAPDTPTEGQLGFKKFIQNGAHFEFRPSDKTKDDLPPLKYQSLEEAVAQIPLAIDRFYAYFNEEGQTKSYNPFMGELSFSELELLHYQHFLHHLNQFELLKK